jgi:hypothetical protein
VLIFFFRNIFFNCDFGILFKKMIFTVVHSILGESNMKRQTQVLTFFVTSSLPAICAAQQPMLTNPSVNETEAYGR